MLPFCVSEYLHKANLLHFAVQNSFNINVFACFVSNIYSYIYFLPILRLKVINCLYIMLHYSANPGFSFKNMIFC